MKMEPLKPKQKKQSSPDTGKLDVATPKKKGKFPADNRGKKRKAKILPSHRLIFENYKDQNFRHLGKAIRKTGVYSESLATRVNVLTKSKSWQALMDEKMPEEHLALRHSELLDKRDTRTETDADGNVTRIDDGPNTAAVTKALELAYRLRGSFKEQEAPPASTVMYNLFYKPEVREQMKVFEDGLKQSLINEIAKKNQKDIEEEAEAAEGQRIIDAELTDAESDRK